jgi:hypothetical protein
MRRMAAAPAASGAPRLEKPFDRAQLLEALAPLLP